MERLEQFPHPVPLHTRELVVRYTASEVYASWENTTCLEISATQLGFGGHVQRRGTAHKLDASSSAADSDGGQRDVGNGPFRRILIRGCPFLETKNIHGKRRVWRFVALGVDTVAVAGLSRAESSTMLAIPPVRLR